MQSPVPLLTRHLTALKGILDKAEAFCAARHVEPSALLQDRLFPDMFPFVRQVQFASDHAKGVLRAAGQEPPAMEDREASFAELKDRLDRTVAVLSDLAERAFEGAEGREVVLRSPRGEMRFPGGAEYVWAFAVPNVLFHVTTAYNILRHRGVEIGKRDFFGQA